MDVTKKLMQEHQLILRYIALIGRMAATWEPGVNDDEYFSTLRQIVDFIKTYADHFHHAKEEDILFRHLEGPGVLTHCNPIPVMLFDHEEGRTLTARLLEAIETQNRNDALAYAQGWGEHLTGHIYKEDNVLYPMAEEGLSDFEKSVVLQEYQAAEESQKAGLEAFYEKLLTDLESQQKLLMRAQGPVDSRPPLVQLHRGWLPKV
ncbi:MAG: cation-binding protein [Spirochaetales bacterium]|nr:cation-binding protein [Spirochaetales bacterium]